jgi:hypothetical protein
MHMSRTAIVKTLGNAVDTPTATAVRRMIRSASNGTGPQLEHVHLLIDGDRIDITIFVQASGQDEADAVATLLGARLCYRLGGWRAAS